MRYRIHSHRKKFSRITCHFYWEVNSTWSSDCWFIWLVNETRSVGAVSVGTAQCDERSVLNGVFDRWLKGAPGGYNPQTWLRVDLGVDGHRVSVCTAYVRVCLATARCHWHKRREFIEVFVRSGNIRSAVLFKNLMVSMAVRNFRCSFGTNVFIAVFTRAWNWTLFRK
jgi:hypothetical protein